MDEPKEENNNLNVFQNESVRPENNKATEQIFLETSENKNDDNTNQPTNHQKPKKSYKTQESIPRELLGLCIDMDWCKEKKEIKKTLKSELSDDSDSSDSDSDDEREDKNKKYKLKEPTKKLSKAQERDLELLELYKDKINDKQNKEMEDKSQVKVLDKHKSEKKKSKTSSESLDRSKVKSEHKDKEKLKVQKSLSKDKNKNKDKEKSKFKELVKDKNKDKSKDKENKSEKRKLDTNKKKMDSDSNDNETENKEKKKQKKDNKEKEDKENKEKEKSNENKNAKKETVINHLNKDKENEDMIKVKKETIKDNKGSENEVVDVSLFKNYRFDYDFMINPRRPLVFYRIKPGKEVDLFDLLLSKSDVVRSSVDLYKGIFVVNNVTDYGMVSYSSLTESNKNALSKYVSVDKSQYFSDNKDSSVKYEFDFDDGSVSCFIFEDIALYINEKILDLCVILKSIATDNYEFDSRRNRSSLTNNLKPFKVSKISCNYSSKKTRFLAAEEKRKEWLKALDRERDQENNKEKEENQNKEKEDKEDKEKEEKENKSEKRKLDTNKKRMDSDSDDNETENKEKKKQKKDNKEKEDKENKEKEKSNENKNAKKEFGEYWYLKFTLDRGVFVPELRKLKHSSRFKVYDESLIPKNRSKISVLRNVIASVLNFHKHKESQKNIEQVKELPIQLCVYDKEQDPSFNECCCLCCKLTIQLLTVNSMYAPGSCQKELKYRSDKRHITFRFVDVLNQTFIDSKQKNKEKEKEKDVKDKENKEKEENQNKEKEQPDKQKNKIKVKTENKGTPKMTYSKSTSLEKEIDKDKEKENKNKYKDEEEEEEEEEQEDSDEDYEDLTMDSVHRITRRMVKELHSVDTSPVRKSKERNKSEDRVKDIESEDDKTEDKEEENKEKNKIKREKKMLDTNKEYKKEKIDKKKYKEKEKEKDVKDKKKDKQEDKSKENKGTPKMTYSKSLSLEKDKDKENKNKEYKDKEDKDKRDEQNKDKEDKTKGKDKVKTEKEVKVQFNLESRESVTKKKTKTSNELSDEKVESVKVERVYPGSGRQIHITDCNAGFIYVGYIVKYALIDKEREGKPKAYTYAVIKYWDPKVKAFFVHLLNEEITKASSDIQIYRNYLSSEQYPYQESLSWISTYNHTITTIGDRPVFYRTKEKEKDNKFKEKQMEVDKEEKENKEIEDDEEDEEEKDKEKYPSCRICNKKIMYIRKDFSKLPEMWDKDDYDDELAFSDFVSEFLSTYDYPNLLFRNPVHSTILSLRELEQLGFSNVIKLLENNLDITTMFFKGYKRASVNIYSKFMLYTCVKLIWWIRKYSKIRDRLYKKSPIKLVYWGFKCSTCSNHYHAKCLQYQHLRKPSPKMDRETVVNRLNIHRTMCRNFKVMSHLRSSYYSNENLFWTTDFKLNLDPKDDIYPEKYFHFPVKIMNGAEYEEESDMDLETMLSKYYPNRSYSDSDKDRNVCVKLLVESMEELPPESESSKFYMFYPLLDSTQESNTWSCSDCRECMYCCLPIQPNLYLNRFNYGYGFNDSTMKSYKQFPPCFEEKVDHLQRNCLQTDKVNHVVCVSCNVAAHRRCCNPMVPNLLFIESWKCDSCTQCISCGYRDPSYVEYLNWGLFFCFCLKCWELLERSNYCGICYKVWTHFDSSSQKWVQCEGCKLWIHVECDDLARLITECPSSRSQNYRCYICRSPDKILRCMKLLEQIFVIDKLNQFRYPVSPNFITYWRLVTKPMNLVMLFTKLEGGKYVTFTEFIFDTFLIPYNAKMVNMPNTKIYRFAIIFERKLRQLVTSIMQIDSNEIDAIVNAGISGGDFLAKEKMLLGGVKEKTLDKEKENKTEDKEEENKYKDDDEEEEEVEEDNDSDEDYEDKRCRVEAPKLVQQKPVESYKSQVDKFNFTFEFLISKILNIDIKNCQYCPPLVKDFNLEVGSRNQRHLRSWKTLNRSKPLNYRLVGQMFESFVPCGLNYVVSSLVSIFGTPFMFPPMFSNKEDFLQLVRTSKITLMNKNQPRNPYFESLVQKSKGMPAAEVYEFYIDTDEQIEKMSKTLFRSGFLQFDDVCIVCGSNSFQSYLIYCEDCAEPMHYYCAGFIFPPKYVDYKRFKCAGCTKCEKCNRKVCSNHQYDLSNINNFHFGDALGFIPTLITNIVLYSAQIIAEETLDQQVPKTDANNPLHLSEYERFEKNNRQKFATFLDGRFRVDHNGMINSTYAGEFTYQSKFPLNTVRCVGCGNSAHLSCIKIINPPTNPFSTYSKFTSCMSSEESPGLFGNKNVDWSLKQGALKFKFYKSRNRDSEIYYDDFHVFMQDKNKNTNQNMKDFRHDPHKYFKKLLLTRSDLLKKEEKGDRDKENKEKKQNEKEKEEKNNKEVEKEEKDMEIEQVDKQEKEMELEDDENKEKQENNETDEEKQMEVDQEEKEEDKETDDNKEKERDEEREQEVDNEEKEKVKQMELDKVKNLNKELNIFGGKLDTKYLLLLAKKLSLCDDLIKMIQVHVSSNQANIIQMANGAPSIYDYKLKNDSMNHNQQNGNKKKRDEQEENNENKEDEEHEEKEKEMELEDEEEKEKQENKEREDNEENKDKNTNKDNNYSHCEFGHIFKDLEKKAQKNKENEEKELKISYNKSCFVPENYLNWEFDGSGLFTCTPECQQNYYKFKDINSSHELLFTNSLAMQFEVLQERYNLLPNESKEIGVGFHLRAIRNGLKAQEDYENNKAKMYRNKNKNKGEKREEKEQNEREKNKEREQENNNMEIDKEEKENKEIELEQVNKIYYDENVMRKHTNGENKTEEVYVSNHCALCGRSMKRLLEMRSSQKIITNNEKVELLLPNSVTNWIMCGYCRFYRNYKKKVSKKIKESINKKNGKVERYDSDTYFYVPENYRDSVLSTISSKYFTNLLSVVRKWMLTSENLVNYLITLVSTLVPRYVPNAMLKRVVYNFLKRAEGSYVYSYVCNAMISSPLSPVVFTNWKKTLLNYHLMDFDVFSGRMGGPDDYMYKGYEMPVFKEYDIDYIHHNPKHRVTRMNLSYFIMIKRYTELVSQSSRLFWTYRDLLSYKIFFKNLGFTRKFDKNSPYYKYNKRSILLLSTRLQKLFYHIINGDIYSDNWSQKLKHRFPYLRKHMAHLILNGDVKWYKDAETNPNSPWLFHYSRVDGGTTSPSFILGKISYEAEAILSILYEFVRFSSAQYKSVIPKREGTNGLQSCSNVSSNFGLSVFNGTMNQQKVDEVPCAESFPDQLLDKLDTDYIDSDNNNKENKERDEVNKTENKEKNTNRRYKEYKEMEVEDEEEKQNKEAKEVEEDKNKNEESKRLTFKRALAELRKLNKVNEKGPRSHLQENITIFDSRFDRKPIFSFDMDQLYRSLELVKEKIKVQSKMERLELFLSENVGSSLLVDVVSARAIAGDVAIGNRLAYNEAVTEFTVNTENLIKPAYSAHLNMCNRKKDTKYQNGENNNNMEVDKEEKENKEKNTKENNMEYRNKFGNGMKKHMNNVFSLIDACCLCGIAKNTLLRGSLLPWRNGYVHSECLLWSVSDVYLPRTYNFNYDSFYTLFESTQPVFVDKSPGLQAHKTYTNNQKKSTKFVYRKFEGDSFVESKEKEDAENKETDEQEEKQMEVNQEQPNEEEKQVDELENEICEQDIYQKVNQRYDTNQDEYEEEGEREEQVVNEEEEEDNKTENKDNDEEKQMEIDKENNEHNMEVESSVSFDCNEGTREEESQPEENYSNKGDATTEEEDETQEPQVKLQKKPDSYYQDSGPELEEANINLMYLPVLPPVQIPDSAVDKIYKQSISTMCSWCNTFGATVKCAGYNCNVSFHLSCAFESSSKLVHLLFERDVKEREYAGCVFPVKMFYTRRKIWCASCFERIEKNLVSFHTKRLKNSKKTELKTFFSLEGISSNAVKIVSRQTLQSVRIIPRQVDYTKLDSFLTMSACSYGNIKSSYKQTMFKNPMEPKLSEFITSVFKPDFKPELIQKINSEYDFDNKIYLYGSDKDLSSPFSNRVSGICYPQGVTHSVYRVGSVTVLNLGEALLQDNRGAFYPIGFTTVRKFWNCNYFNTYEEEKEIEGYDKEDEEEEEEDDDNMEVDDNENKENDNDEKEEETEQEEQEDKQMELDQEENKNNDEEKQEEDKEREEQEVDNEEEDKENKEMDVQKYFGNTYRSYYLCSIRCLDGMPYFTMDLISPPDSRLPNKRVSEGSNIYEVFDNFKVKMGLEYIKMNAETFFGLNLNIVLQQMRYELGFTMLKRATQFCKISAFKKSVFGSRFNNYDLTMRLGEPKLNLPYRFNRVMTLSNITTALDFKEQGQTDLDLTDNRLNRSRQRKQFDMSNSSTQYRYLISFPAERRLDVKPSVIHGLGLFANEFIPAGEPVVEYVGELIRDVIGDRREEVYSEIQGGDGSCYMFRLDDQLIVDATNKGNMSRFINHSCDPNCLCRIITCENGLKHIVVFAKTDLNPGDEVTYDYQFGVESETRKLACLCGAANCLGRMN